MKQEPPKEDPTGPTMTSVVVNHILNEDDKDDEADIQKVVHRINTDEERFTNAMKSNKDWTKSDITINYCSEWVRKVCFVTLHKQSLLFKK